MMLTSSFLTIILIVAAYGIGSIPIDTAILDEIAPGLTSLSLTPIISNNFVQAPGVITVGGQLFMEGTLDTPPPNPIE